ncbi:allergin-1 isoform X3 [Aquarana catesbeiana]|uniref:allergin-1 isoform X3 n=1 Tax=Aquarana catesbeiana TaxID=8400 RepID=UPI003CC9673E
MEVLWLAAFCLLNVAVPRIRGDHNISKTLRNPLLFTGSPSVTRGSTVTIYCRCENASLPVTFMLFQNTSTKGRVMMSEKAEATFNLTIHNHTSLGPYKCKANNSANTGLYSKDFYFTLQEHPPHGPGPTGQEAIQEDNTYEYVREKEPETQQEEEVHYSTVIQKKGNRDVTCAEPTAEYSVVTRTRPKVQQQP